MASPLSSIKLACLKLSQLFGGVLHARRAGFSGLGQFVVLLALAPFIFDLSLYSFVSQKEVPSLYEYDADRFPSLPAYPALGEPPRAPAKPRGLTKVQERTLKNCQVLAYTPFLFNRGQIERICSQLKKKKAIYQKQKKAYPAARKAYLKKRDAYEARVKQQREAKAAYSNLRLELSTKPPVPSPLLPKETSSRSFTALLGSSLALDVWKTIGTAFWWLGALLVGPALWLSVRWRCWGLLLFGLAVPTVNYGLSFLALIPGFSGLLALQIHSVVAAQLAFGWFALKGHISSRSFPLFALLLSIAASWAALSIGGGLSVFKAQLPILIFVVVALMARLVVVGFLENRYLFAGKGWLVNLRQGGHAFLLWLPLAALAFPLLFLTEVTLPKAVTNHLHQQKVLQFGYGHDLLDNALQSTAARTDDAIYAWHLSMEEVKRDIHTRSTRLQQEDLTRRVANVFDQVMPAQLEFDPYQSDKVIIGPAVELAVHASQDSTNGAFQRMRARMKASLLRVTASYEGDFKQAVEKQTAVALKVVDDLYQEGRNGLLEANRQAQVALWWTLNYARAAHLLSILVFVFACLKSYFYVFSRVSFHRRTGTFVTLGKTEPEVEETASRITPTGLQYVIDGDTADTFYVSRRFQCRGKAPRFTIPQPSKAALARLIHGAYSMK